MTTDDNRNEDRNAQIERIVAECVTAWDDLGTDGIRGILRRHQAHAVELHQRLQQLVRLGLMPIEALGDEAAPERIGPYRLVRLLGEGGMGSVWLGEQESPIRRQVAIKVIKLGMDTRAVLERFETERQTLALMSHECIARVLDAGATDRGQPWFAMEYVPGLPLVEHCDRNRLPVNDRLQLFRRVCAGVQHAHQKGVIHRDLKPANVLVTLEQGEAVPKIIDFGLARATDRAAIPRRTEQRTVLGTPEYMSPEQAAVPAQDIDTRTDVYSLGVMLYEILVGQLPFAPANLHSADFGEIWRRIREEDPPRPSSCLGNRVVEAGHAAACRRTTASALAQAVRGDLDCIVACAMAKDRAQRYPSAAALADDLGRHLAHEPVQARPPSASYVLRKLARRYRPQLWAAAATLLALLTGLATTLWFMLRARENEAIAQASVERANARQREFDQLACAVRLEQLRARAATMAGPWTDLEAPRSWLADASALLADRTGLLTTIAELRNRALPAAVTAAVESPADPTTGSVPELQTHLAGLERELAALQLQATPNPTPNAAEAAMTSRRINDQVWPLVDPRAHQSLQVHVPTALVLARLAWDKAAGLPAHERCILADTLAWACFWNGLDDEADEHASRALDLASAGDRAAQQAVYDDLRRRIAAGEGHAAIAVEAQRCTDERSRVQAEIARFATPATPQSPPRLADASLQFLHDALAGLIRRLADFEHREFAHIRARLEAAEVSLAPTARAAWERAAAAITSADGVSASTRYREHPIQLRPQPGLLPIGMNPATGLWEFHDLRSSIDHRVAANGARPSVPEHGPDGGIRTTEDMGIVFVLIPGGSFTIGAQNQDPKQAGFDPGAWAEDLPPHRVTVPPFFLARHELTQGQWHRLGGVRDPRIAHVSQALPITQVSWFQADELLRAHGLMLPTEIQWEYACRAGTTTPWWTGADAASLGDEGAGVRIGGSRRANPFGLYDVHGNVWEWCADWHYGWSPLLLSLPDESARRRVLRGGAANYDAGVARSSHRSRHAPGVANGDLGLRPARALVP